MNLFQITLSVTSGILFILGIYFAVRSLFVVKTINKYFYFAVTTLGGTVYIFFGLVLSYNYSSETVLLVHRCRMFGLMFCLTFWFYFLYDMYFKNHALPKITLFFNFVIACTIPSSLFLRLPVRYLQIDKFGMVFNYSFATPNITYTFFAFFLESISLFSFFMALRSKISRIGKLHCSLGFFIPVISSVNDFLVSHGIINSILISEYTVLVFVLATFVVFIAEDQNEYKQLQKLNENLEAAVAERTKTFINEENQKIAYQNQMFQSAKMASIGQLAAGVAHEINNPLMIMLGRFDILKEQLQNIGLKNNEIFKSLDIEYSSLKRVSVIVNQLLTYAGKDLTILEKVDVNDSIDSCIKLFNSIYTNYKMGISVNSQTKDLFINGNSSKLQQIIMNFITNAIEALSSIDNPNLSINSGVEGNNVIIKISDNGLGIKKEDLSKIFDPASIINPDKDHSILNFTANYVLIKAMNGDMKIDSREGFGTVITLIFPKI